jgi:hypothetical protein
MICGRPALWVTYKIVGPGLVTTYYYFCHAHAEEEAGKVGTSEGWRHPHPCTVPGMKCGQRRVRVTPSGWFKRSHYETREGNE